MVQLSHPYVANEIILYYTVIIISVRILETSLVAQLVKNLPAVYGKPRRRTLETLEKEMVTHSRILAYSCLGQRSLVGYSPRGHKSQTQLSN